MDDAKAIDLWREVLLELGESRWDAELLHDEWSQVGGDASIAVSVPTKKQVEQVESYLTDHDVPAGSIGPDGRACPMEYTSGPCSGSRAWNTSG